MPNISINIEAPMKINRENPFQSPGFIDQLQKAKNTNQINIPISVIRILANTRLKKFFIILY